MNTRTIIGLTVAAAILALGLALNGDPARPSTPGAMLTVLGGAGAAVCITLWAAHAMNLGRRLERTRHGGPRIDALIDTLIECAAQADSRGVLTLSDRTILEHPGLFAEGVEMLIRADPTDAIRRALGARAEREAVAASLARRRMATICRVVPIVALTLALATLIWMLASMGKPSQIGSLTPLALVVTVYGAFAVAAVSAEMGDRVASAGLRDELTRVLVIETIVAMREGETSDRVEAKLRGFLPPAEPVATPRVLRRAA
jgi:flagellar motor component MotA